MKHEYSLYRFDTRKIGIRFLLIAVISWGVGLMPAANAWGATLVVGNCTGATGFATIQEAVNHAASGDAVDVCPGTYPEIISIDQSLTLRGIRPGRDRVLPLPTIIYPRSTDVLCTFGIRCPQISARNATTVNVEDLNVDGSNFSGADCTVGIPIGILFDETSGSVVGTTVTNHTVPCSVGPPPFFGDGIDAFGGTSISISNNTVSGFGNAGITVQQFKAASNSGAINANLITSTTDIDGANPITVASINAFAISNNTVSAPTPSKAIGVVIAQATNTTVAANNITNFLTGIALTLVDSSTFFFNVISNPATNVLDSVSSGISLDCSSGNSFALNGMSIGTQPGGTAGVRFDACNSPSDNNSIVINFIDGYCTGIQTGDSANTGNTLMPNFYTNIGPGSDVMPGFACP